MRHSDDENSFGRDGGDYGKLFGQQPAGTSMMPKWLQVAYTWVLVTFTLTLACWFLFRAMGAERGDTPQAITAIVVGFIAGTGVTVWAHWLRGRRRGAGRNQGTNGGDQE